MRVVTSCQPKSRHNINFVDFLDECEVSFVHNPSRKLATASTCDLQLRLPVCQGDHYESFKQDMILSAKGNDGFGGP